uniref:Uncharacterized protein n=1 Tax=Tanacetum cinerariifolium TaxID=118510 RepID=A0A6L2JQ18_TANCI|nr:hypothetical protein [Tanacetum cinerariifolium]
MNTERCTKHKWKTGKLEQVPIKVYGKIPTLLQDLEELHEKEKFVMDRRSRKNIPRDEKAHCRTSAAHIAKSTRGSHNVPLCSQRGDQCGPVTGKRLETNANLFCQSRATSSRDQLQPNGKTDTRPSTCFKETKKILSGTYNSGCHRSANQTNLVST